MLEQLPTLTEPKAAAALTKENVAAQTGADHGATVGR
jgi:hypothetical protein